MKNTAIITAAIAVSLFSVQAHSNHSPGTVGGLVANHGAIQVQDSALVDSFDSTLGSYGRGNVGAAASAYACADVTVHPGSSFNGEGFSNSAAMLSLINCPVPVGIAQGGDFVLADYTYQYLPAGDYHFDSLSIGNGAYLDIDGETRIWVDGNVVVRGQMQVRSYEPSDLWIMGTENSDTVEFLGTGAAMMGHVYAPSALLVMAGSEVYGSLTGNIVDIQANSKFHFDEATPALDPSLRVVEAATAPETEDAAIFSRSDNMVLGPVPSAVGQPVCLFPPSPTNHTNWNVFNAMGERVAELEFNDPSGQCWTPSGLAPGVYVVHIAAAFTDGTASAETRKIVVQN